MDEHQECVREVDGAALVDHKGAPVTVERFLASRPLRVEISTRVGPVSLFGFAVSPCTGRPNSSCTICSDTLTDVTMQGGKKLSYMGGETVIKTLNDAFGYDGWSSEVRSTTREETQKDDKGRYHVAYVATVRVTHRRSGAYREDCGVGDAIDRSLASASGNALKGAVTDALKRAARQFGEKLGNSLYHDGFNANNAPGTLKESLDALDIERAKTRFGFPKDRVKVQVQNNNIGGAQSKVKSGVVAANTNRTVTANGAASAATRQQQNAQHTKNSYGAAKTAHKTPAPPVRTQYVGNAVMEHSLASRQAHATPHQSGGGVGAPAPGGKGTYVTPANRAAPGAAAGMKGTGSSFDPTAYAAVPANKLAENSNPQRTAGGGGVGGGGLNLPARPGTAGPRPNTSRGGGDGGLSPTSSYISQLGGSGTGETPSMFASGGGMSRALAVQTQQSQQNGGGVSLAKTLKRKSEGGPDGGGPARNPYSQAAQQGQ